MTPLRLLAIASRPSDFVEMADLARALVARKHEVSLIYFYSREDPGAGRAIEHGRELSQSGVHVDTIEVTQLPDSLGAIATGAAASGPTPAVATTAPASSAAETLRSIATVTRRLGITPRNTFAGRAAYAAMHGIDAVRDRPRMAQAAELRRWLRPRLRELPWKLRMQAPLRMFQAAATLLYYKKYAAFFRRSIAQRRVQALLIPEDIVGNVWPVAIRAGHECGIPTLVLPYTLADHAEAIQSLKDAAGYQSGQNALAATLYPRWRHHDGAIDIVRLPSPHVFAHEHLGIAPPDPWMMNSGFADRILVDSAASFDYFRAGGIPSEQMEVVGSVSQDRMFERRARRAEHLDRLRSDLGVSGVKPLLLISGCPNQLTAQVPRCEFKTIEDVAAWVGESVAPLASHYHLVVRPHPNFIEFGDMLARFGVVTTMAPTSSLVPLSDVFVAFASATIRWAIACGIPTLNYDVFHYGYGDFASAQGVWTVSESGDFRERVRRMIPGTAEMTALAAGAANDVAQWSVMDGRGVERIEQAIMKARAGGAAIKEQQGHA